MNIQNSPNFGSAFFVQGNGNRSTVNRLIKDFREKEGVNLYESSDNPDGKFIMSCKDKDDRRVEYYLKNELMPGRELEVTKFDTVI